MKPRDCFQFLRNAYRQSCGVVMAIIAVWTVITTPDDHQYLGLLYAAPPVGALRSLPPQPPAKFIGVFQANQCGNIRTRTGFAGRSTGDEDCLTLNVYVPRGDD